MLGSSPQSFRMKLVWWCGWLLAIALLDSGCRKPVESSAAIPPLVESSPTKQLPKLSVLKLWLGPQELAAEIARSPIEIQTGMMFRTNIAENAGMLFILPYTQQAAFWMKNCVVPLSVAYIDPEGTLQEIHDLQPGNTNPVFSASLNVRFALEVSQGWFTRHQVSTGMVVRTERGTLAETFGGRR
jgi:uncharacterized protein